MKRFVKILIPILIIALGAIACGSSDNAGTLASNSTPSNKTTGSTPTAAPANKHFKIGESVDVGGKWKVTVNGITTNPGGQYQSPKGIYVVINVSLTNTSSQEQDLSSMNFGLKNTDGTKYDVEYVSSIDGISEMPTGKVEANGGKAKGDLVFDVPTSAKSFIFSFAPAMFSSGQTLWDLSL